MINSTAFNLRRHNYIGIKTIRVYNIFINSVAKIVYFRRGREERGGQVDSIMVTIWNSISCT